MKKRAERARKAKQRRHKPASVPLWGYLLLFALGVGLYLNTLGHDFVIDDRALITQNRQVYELRLDEILSLSGYRPIRTLTYAVNYVLGGEDPSGYHFFNVVLHALNGVLLARLVFLWTASPVISLLAALLFLVHPVQTAAVAYVSGRKDLLAAFFVLAGLTAYTRYRREGGKLRLAGALILFALGILSKEVAIIFPLLLVLLEGCVLARREGRTEDRLLFWRRVFRRPLRLYVAALLLALGGLLYAVFLAGASRMVGLWGGNLLTNLGTSFKLFAHYLKLTVWPHPLIADYKGEVFPPSSGLLEPATLGAVLLTLGYVAGAVWTYGRRPLISLGLLWFLATLLPVLQLIPFHEIAADHFLYLPVAGIALAAAVAGAPFLSRPTTQTAAAAVCLVLVLAYALRTVDRNRDWHDDRTLWEVTYQTAPGSYRANANLGRIYFDQVGNTALRRKAMALTRRAVELAPNDPAATANLGSMLFVQAKDLLSQGDEEQARRLTEQAIEALQTALEKNPWDGSVLNNLGNCQRQMATIWERSGDQQKARGSREEARNYYEQALARDHRKEVGGAWYNLGLLYMDRREYREAIRCFGQFVAQRPGDPDGNGQMGFCYFNLGEYEQASSYLEKTVQRRPTVPVLFYLADSYQRSNQIEKEIGVYERGVRWFPDVLHFDLNLGILYYQTGRPRKALEHLEKVAQSGSAPDLAEKARKWAEIVRKTGPPQLSGEKRGTQVDKKSENE